MRQRLEYREGTSDKFWEVCLDGSEMTLRWGRVGSTGQTRTRSFPGPEAALAEARKLVQEKLRKGYREAAPEDGAHAREDDAPVGRSQRAEPPVQDDWQTALRLRHNPWRRDPAPPLAPGPAPKKPRSEELALYRAGLGLTVPTLQAAARWALGCLETGSAEDPVPLGVAHLLTLREGQHADFLAARLPPRAFLEAVLQAEELTVSSRYGSSKLVATWVMRKNPQHPHYGPLPVGLWAALRRALAGCPEGDYREALDLALPLYAAGDHEARCRLAFAFPDQSWAEAEAHFGLTHQNTLYGQVTMIPPCTFFTLGSLTDLELARQIVEHPYGQLPPEVAPMLVGNHGRQAFPLLLARSGCRDCLWEIPDLELAGALTGLLDDRSERAHLADYYTRWPHLGVPVLARVLATQARGRDVARTLLTRILRQHPELPALEPREEKACRELLSRLQGTGPVATPSELPSVLRKLPQPQTRHRVVQSVALPADFPERIHWDGPAPQGYAHEPPPPPGPLDEKLAHAFGRALERGPVAIWDLERLSDPLALRFWNETPPKKWAYQDPESLGRILARFGLEALPGCLAQAEVEPAAMAQVLAPVESPRVAAVMAPAFVSQRGARTARAWMRRFPEAASLGLATLAVGPTGARREAAEAACRWLVAQGQEAILREAARKLGASQALDEVLSVDPLAEVPAKLPRLPEFFDPALLPVPRLKSQSPLNAEAVKNLATMLAFSPLDPPYAGLERVRQACDPESLDEFAWELFSLWLTAGGPTREKWAFLALGHLGGDESARRLAPLLRAWPQEGLFARAELGLDVLGAMGTDVALMHVHQMSQRVKSRALQEKARLKLEEIALRRGLSAEELADRLVPDLDLDPDGTCTLVVGGKAFRVVFDEHLNPGLIGPEGKPAKDLPRSARPEDAAALARWKTLKKDARAVAQSQVLRLELAMSAQRRWGAETWRAFWLEHPLLVHLVRRVVWGAYRDDRLAETFRVAEDSSLADVEDRPWQLPAEATVGVPHPLELEPELLTKWAQLFADYAILQPFAQLARPVYRADSLERLSGRKVAALKLLSLESRGWRRGQAQDGGFVWTVEKRLGPSLTAVLEVEPGFSVAAPRDSEEQMVSQVTLRRAGETRPRPLQEAGPIALSDVVADLEGIL